MPACGGTMIAVNASTSIIPRLLMVKVAPEMSAGVRRLARARSVSSLRCFAMSPSASLSAFLMTAVTTAFSTAIARRDVHLGDAWRSSRCSSCRSSAGSGAARARRRPPGCRCASPSRRATARSSGTRRAREALRFDASTARGDVELRHLRPALRRALGHDLADRRHRTGVGGGRGGSTRAARRLTAVAPEPRAAQPAARRRHAAPS